MLQQKKLKTHLQENMSLYIFVSITLLMGIIFGALLVNALAYQQNEEISNFLGSFLHMISQGGQGEEVSYLKQSLFSHLKWLLLIWILGLSVIGLPIILILNFLKGVLVGFTVGYLVSDMSWHGLLFALVAVAPQNLIIIPAFIICSVAAMSFSIYVVKHRFVQRNGEVKPQLLEYTYITIAFMLLTGLSSVFEAYVTPHLLEQVAAMIISKG